MLTSCLSSFTSHGPKLIDIHTLADFKAHTPSSYIATTWKGYFLLLREALPFICTYRWSDTQTCTHPLITWSLCLEKFTLVWHFTKELHHYNLNPLTSTNLINFAFLSLATMLLFALWIFCLFRYSYILTDSTQGVCPLKQFSFLFLDGSCLGSLLVSSSVVICDISSLTVTQFHPWLLSELFKGYCLIPVTSYLGDVSRGFSIALV